MIPHRAADKQCEPTKRLARSGGAVRTLPAACAQFFNRREDESAVHLVNFDGAAGGGD